MSRTALALGIAAAPFAVAASMLFGAPSAMADNYQASSQYRGPMITASPTTYAPDSFGCSTARATGCTPSQYRVYSLHGK